MTLWQWAAKVILAFLIFAVLVLQVHDCRPYTPFQTVKLFTLINNNDDYAYKQRLKFYSNKRRHDYINLVFSLHTV